MGSPSNGPSPQQLNQLARSLIMNNSVEMKQQIFTQTFDPRSVTQLNIIPRNVGLIKGFWVEVTATVTNSGSTTAITPTNFGPANVLSQIVFTDLNNQTRIQTTGWHMEMINTAKARRVYAMAMLTAGMDTPIGYGSNWNVISSTASIAASGGTGTIVMRYWVPLAYSDTDYRGAVYANVINATMNLQLTPNPSAVVASGDSTLACYAGNTGAITSMTVTVYQVYMDQIPVGKGGPVLPILDLSTIYELKNTTFTSVTVGQDFPMQYTNFRDFLSTFAVYYNGSARAAGTDVNYWALQSANFTNIFKLNPYLIALQSRNTIWTDFPLGVYYFNSRQKPIATTQYGNMELILNPSTAGATAYVAVGYEDFGMVNTLTQAGSLPAA